MARKHMPADNVKATLIESRRRCCVCYALERNNKVRKGQIAHLDQDNSNHNKGNLAWLCFDHHDEYDGKTSQSKKLTIQEVKLYKRELLEWVNVFLVPERSAEGPPKPEEAGHDDPYAGLWLRINSDDNQSEIQVVLLPPNMDGDVRYFVSGLGFRGINEGVGSVGEFDFYATLSYDFAGNGDFLRYMREGDVALELTFTSDGHLVVTENTKKTPYGTGAKFAGSYYRSVESKE
ncbi:hypothetical protein [Shinella zoogloeoides]|uniref:hypothetical protein n=1 Tax=Shinella zoogloeoides TaxID=352475 RepID=UPI0028A9EB2D|nr:hypothetical protein [Shinella zoogloeoides]